MPLHPPHLAKTSEHNQENESMNMRCKFVVALAAVALVAAGTLMLSRDVNAAGEGKITGTIKLDGTAPHQRPIDMSKEPSCQKQHEGHPITTENVVVGPNAGLQNVVVYISEGMNGAAGTPSQTPAFEQK